MNSSSLRTYLTMRGIAPFSCLERSMLLLLSSLLVERTLRSGSVLGAAGAMPHRLIIVTAGSAQTVDGSKLYAPEFPLLGFEEIIHNLPFAQDIHVSEEGLSFYQLSKARMLSFLEEYPDVLFEHFANKLERSSGLKGEQ